METMNWVSPRHEEIKMDAEIGSYQVDPDVPERGGEYAASSRVADPALALRSVEAAARAA
jgi:hypothetical protein